MYPPPLYTRWADPPAKIPLTMNSSSAPFVPTASWPVSNANEAESLTEAVRSPTASYATHRNVALFITNKVDGRVFPGIAPRSTDAAPAHSPGVIAPSTVGGDKDKGETITPRGWARDGRAPPRNPAAATAATSAHATFHNRERRLPASMSDPP